MSKYVRYELCYTEEAASNDQEWPTESLVGNIVVFYCSIDVVGVCTSLSICVTAEGVRVFVHLIYGLFFCFLRGFLLMSA